MPHWMTGLLTCLLILLNTLIGIGPMLLLGLIKLLPWPPLQRAC